VEFCSLCVTQALYAKCSVDLFEGDGISCHISGPLQYVPLFASDFRCQESQLTLKCGWALDFAYYPGRHALSLVKQRHIRPRVGFEDLRTFCQVPLRSLVKSRCQTLPNFLPSEGLPRPKSTTSRWSMAPLVRKMSSAPWETSPRRMRDE
jgi:hypothetical protein